MMRSKVDFPAPLAPSTPIFAPWKNESQMPRRISRLGGTTFRRSFMTNAYSPAIHLEKGAPSPPSRLPLSVSRSGSNETAVFGHHAAVLDDADPGAGQCLGGRVVPDAELEPDRARPPRQRQDLGRVAREVFGAAGV